MKRLLFWFFFLAVPSAAIWHPATASGGPANLLSVWAFFYVVLFCLISNMALAISSFSDDKKVLLRIIKGRSTFMVWANFLVRGIWAVGAIYRGWWFTGVILSAGWLVTPCLGWFAFNLAESELEKSQSAEVGVKP